MQGFSGILIYAMGVAILLVPIVLVLILATIVANLFSGVWKPVTEPIRAGMEKLSELVPNPLDRIPSFPKLKGVLGSTKNILFVGFAFIYLLIHYLVMENASFTLLNTSLMFPGSAFDETMSFFMSFQELDWSYFLVNPEFYLRTIIFSGITGLFLNLGCTTKAEDAKIHFLVKIGYILVITLFSSVVLEKIPPEVFTITLPEYSARLEPVKLVIDNAKGATLLEALGQWGGILLEKLVALIPVILAAWFLCQTISGFAAALLGGVSALAALSMTSPQVFLEPESFGSSVLVLVAVTLAQAVALLFGEWVDGMAARLIEKLDGLFAYYNIVTILLFYFFYPTLLLPALTHFTSSANGIDFTGFLVCAACLVVFSLVIFLSYKISQWVWKDAIEVSVKKFVLLMVMNIPVLLIYSTMFRL